MVSIIKMLERSRKKSARNEQSNKKFDRFIKFLRHLIKFLYQRRFDLVVRSWNLSRIEIFGKSKSSRIVFILLLVFFQFTPPLLPSFPRLFDSKARLRFLSRIYPLLYSVFFVYRRTCRIQDSVRNKNIVFVLYFFVLVSRNREEGSSRANAREIELAISEILQATVENRLEILPSSSLIFKIFVT